MPETTPLQPLAPWVSLASTDADWDALEPRVLDTMLAQLHLIRTFEEEVLGLAGQKLINGPAHASIGQEAGAVGSVLPLVGADQVNGSHRGHHQFLAKAIGYVAPDGVDPRKPLPEKVREVLHKSMAEIAGLKDGYCYGRGGSMHLQWIDAGAMGTNAIVGGAVPFAAGFAFADKWADTDNVSVTYFGDGATNIGSVLETMNLAAAWKLPVCFFIENNQYAVSTTVQEATGEPRLSARGLGFGIPSWQVDGQDVVAVYLAMQQACEHMRNGGGPTVVEADTYRYFHQNGPFPGSAFGYRSQAGGGVLARPRPDREDRGPPRPPRPLHRGRARRRPQVDQGRDGRDRRGPGRAGPRRASRASSASARSCGRTRRSSTSASAATCRAWRG